MLVFRLSTSLVDFQSSFFIFIDAYVLPSPLLAPFSRQYLTTLCFLLNMRLKYLLKKNSRKKIDNNQLLPIFQKGCFEMDVKMHTKLSIIKSLNFSYLGWSWATLIISFKFEYLSCPFLASFIQMTTDFFLFTVEPVVVFFAVIYCLQLGVCGSKFSRFVLFSHSIDIIWKF